MEQIVPRPKTSQKKQRRIVRCSGNEIEFSDGTVLKSNIGEFDIDIVKAILEAGD